MLVIKDNIEEGASVTTVASSEMFKVLKWEEGYQLTCKLEGGSGVHVYRKVLWCAGELTVACECGEFTYSGDGGVSLETSIRPVSLVKLAEHNGSIITRKASVLAVPEGYNVGSTNEEGMLTISGSGVVPLESDYEPSEFVSIVIGGEASVLAETSRLLCWSASLHREVLTRPKGMSRFTGSGTVILCKGH